MPNNAIVCSPWYRDLSAYRSLPEGIIDTPVVIGVTGHRPQYVHPKKPFDPLSHLRLTVFAREYISWLKQKYPNLRGVITGMAQGWDMAIAQACVELKVPFQAAVPFAGQEKKWPKKTQEYYQQLLDAAAGVKVVCPGGYAAWKMMKRNAYIITKSDIVVCLWDPEKESGGTYGAVTHALKDQKTVINLWPRWQSSIKADKERTWAIAQGENLPSKPWDSL